MLLLLRQARYLALVASGIVLASACVAAGLWQIHRYQGKHVANAELRHNDARPAVPVDRLLAPDRPLDPHERFRQVTARGRFDVTGQMFVRQRQVDNQAGYLVLTPLRTDAGPLLLVVRGWVPVGGSATQTPTVPPPPSGELRLTGLAFPSEGPAHQRGLPARQIERIDVPEIARRLGTATYGGYVQLTSVRPSEHGVRPLPLPDLSNPSGGAFEGQHLAYIVQWFFFAALALAAPPVLAYKDLHRDGPDRRDPDTDPDADGPALDAAHDTVRTATEHG